MSQGSAAGALGYRRLRAPREDRGVLVEPSQLAPGEVLARNRAYLQASLTHPRAAFLAQLRGEARREALQAALGYTRGYLPQTDADDPIGRFGALGSDTPWILAGHQPQMFHPGVWLKNFALARLAATQRAVAINLVVDNDTLKTASLRVPGGSVDDPLVEAVPFDAAGPEIPYESRAVLDPRLAESFAQRAGQQLAPLIAEPLLKLYWPRVLGRLAETGLWGLALAQARHQLERQWGLATLELPLSLFCQGRSFHRWLCDLLPTADRFLDIHNRALAEYRRVHHLRSRHHPVPELVRDGAWHELPLWISTADDPRRRRLFVRTVGGRYELGDRQSLECQLPWFSPGNAEPALGALAEWSHRGVRLRTRALTTTLLARMIVGDLFLHGIGGAKYDQLTDAIAREYYGWEPPAYLVLSATLALPIAQPNRSVHARGTPAQHLRELTYHPERMIDPARIADPRGRAECLEQIEAKARWIALQPTPANARQRCHAIRQLNQLLGNWVSADRDRWTDAQGNYQRQQRAERILGSREYAFPLYPADVLREFLLEISASRF